MPNTLVQAAAEGLPQMTRRRAIAMTAGGIATAISVLSVKPAAAARAASEASPALLQIEKAFKAHWSIVEAAGKETSAIEAKLNVAKPPRPVDEEWSADLVARFREMPVGRLNDDSHPVVIETREIAARNSAKRAAHYEACAPLDDAMEKSEARYRRLLDKADRIGRRALRIPANSVADIMVKIRIHKLNVFDDAEFFDVVLKDVARLDRLSRKAVL